MQISLKAKVMLIIGAAAYLMSATSYEQFQAIGLGGGPLVGGGDIGLELAENEHFLASGNCDGCHGRDETGHASVDAGGNDISPVTTWRATMMANAAKDPFFRAKVSHESLINPAHSGALEDKCLSCHAPLGRFSYHNSGLGEYGLDDLQTDPFGQDGVSCMACHKQTPERSGLDHSGELHYDTAMNEYGPYTKPYQGPMQGFLNVSPEFGEHVTKGGFCAGCHSLLTNSVDLDGEYTGTTFVEQATYHEWLNSAYSQENGIACQGCHIPRVEEPVVVSANYMILVPRSPYGKHQLVGGNSFMLKLMKEHREELDIRANAVHFDSTITQTLRNLQTKSLTMELHHIGFGEDTAEFRVLLTNRTGHKFPSGYPSRRAYVEFVVTNNVGDTLFSSGVLRPDHTLAVDDQAYEPHYNTIVNDNSVQLYEMVMGNINGDYTSVLEQAYAPLKDNRLVPVGFSTSHATYDTTAIVGNASWDPDFNFNGSEGSGSDAVHYRVGLNGYTDSLWVSARVYYQSVPKKWTQEMFAETTPEIETFRTMYDSADHTPVLVASAALSGVPFNTSINDRQQPSIQAYPNPSNGTVWLSGVRPESVKNVTVFSLDGQRIVATQGYSSAGIALPEKPGVYLIRVATDTGVLTYKVVRK